MSKQVTRRAVLGTGLAAGAVLAAAGCAGLHAPSAASSGTATKKSLTFMAGYKAQADVSFVGVYVAHDRGYFQEQGLDVAIMEDSSGGEHGKLLAAKRIQVTTETAANHVKNVADQGVPFVSLAVLTQSGDQAFATLQSSGIDTPKKFEGKIVGYKSFPSFDYLALLKAAGVDRSKIHEVAVGYDPRVLTEGKVDVLPVFKSNEPDILRHQGFAINVIDPADYGVKVMGQIWITHRDLLAADPDLYLRFTKAALKGLYDAFAHPTAAIDTVMKYAPREDRSHQTYMLSTEQQSTVTEETRRFGLGWQTRAKWSALQDGLAEFGLVKTKVDPSRFFDATLLPTIYRNGQLVWP